MPELMHRNSNGDAPDRSFKSNDIRPEGPTRDDQEGQEMQDPQSLLQDKRGWSYFMQRNSVLRTYQKRLVFNSDIKVATLEFAIMFLSVAQLHWSYKSPHWREKRACTQRAGCVDTLPDSSFAASDAIRAVIALMAVLRLFIRFNQLWKTRSYPKPTLRSKLACFSNYLLELIYTAFFPYPGLEKFFVGTRGDSFVVLSISVVLRTTSWGQWLYYPYPIRQKEKVASFSGNLEFNYRQFVIKKVLDDTPLNKFLTFYTMLGAAVAYVLHVIETIKGDCWWEQDDAEMVRSEDAVCYELYISDSLWMVFMTFLSIGYGDVYPRTIRGQAILAVVACIAVLLDAMFFSIIIKKFTFSTMEARVHAFLYRMELYNKKEVSAVMAVQATFRYNKSYQHSLIWHQQRGSNIFYRPLSDRLPNEVKKKLYASRFQKSLKQIMKYNTDGDPLNTFSKHVEVITAALGATFVDMIRLKKMYYRKVRVLEQRRQQANRRASSFRITSSGRPAMGLPSAGKQLRTQTDTYKLDATSVSLGSSLPNTLAGGLLPGTCSTSTCEVSAAWGDEMQRKCEATMVLLKKIEANMKGIHHNRSW